MNLFDLNGKTAVVIGGNSTLGGTMAVALGAYGADVAVVGRNQETAEQVKSRIEQAGGKAKCFSADTTSKEQLSQVLADVLAWTGRVDVLMNCPGKNSATPFSTLARKNGIRSWRSI
jgi:NAD(P)-dependent dehydrogenase (short-subunit alcohol dehydrogenase family)